MSELPSVCNGLVMATNKCLGLLSLSFLGSVAHTGPVHLYAYPIGHLGVVHLLDNYRTSHIFHEGKQSAEWTAGISVFEGHNDNWWTDHPMHAKSVCPG